MRGCHRLPDGALERFSCGAGPLGWRWTSRRDDGNTLELVVEPDGAVRTLLAVHDGWQVAGSCADGFASWTRDGRRHTAVADGFTGSSPAYAVAVGRLAVALPGRDLVLVEVTEPVGAARTVRQRWTPCPGGEPDLLAWQVDDLERGTRRVVHLHAELLVATTGPEPVVLVQLEL